MPAIAPAGVTPYVGGGPAGKPMRCCSGLIALLVLTPALACGLARAQAPIQRGGTIPLARGADLPDGFISDVRRGPAVPDTTSPWRYYPLGVGDQWEYYDFAQGLDYVRWVAAEEMHNGWRYALVYEGHVPPPRGLNGTGGGLWIRFDMTSAQVYARDEGDEFLWEPCPFAAPFVGFVVCRHPDFVATMGGGYEQLLVFPEGAPPDTLVTAVKTYDQTPSSWYDIRSFAADLGLIYLEDEFRELGLFYARINEVEYGRSRHPVSVEPEPEGSADSELYLISPNPTRGYVTAYFAVDHAGPGLIDVFDVIGRRVLTQAVGPLVSGDHRAAVDLSALAPGTYILRFSTSAGADTRLVNVIN